MLTLANGDRILMTPAMKAFFEPENLNNASPATVSRAGIIYVSDSELGWQPLVASWLQACFWLFSGFPCMHACMQQAYCALEAAALPLSEASTAMQGMHASADLALLSQHQQRIQRISSKADQHCQTSMSTLLEAGMQGCSSRQCRCWV